MSNQLSLDIDRRPPTLVSERALVIFPGALGDLVCLLPALQGLRRRRPVVLLCKQDLARLINASAIAEARPLEQREASWLFSASPPAEADDFYRSFVSVDSFSGFGVGEVEGNLSRWHGSRGRVHPFRPTEPIHLAAHFAQCLGTLYGFPVFDGLEPPENRKTIKRPLLELRGSGVEESRRKLSKRLLGVGRALVLHPGSGGRTKRWSRNGFLEIVERWTRRGGEGVVLLGPAEQGEERAWRRDGVEVLHDLDLVEVAVLVAGSAAYLGNDSGPSHLAAAVGARGVALFGPTDPDCWRPLSPKLHALRVQPWTAFDERAPSSAVDMVDDALTRASKRAHEDEPLA